MFRIVMEINEINYDKLLDTFMQKITEQQKNGMLGGIKIPPMINMGFLKNMPEETKNGMVASAINAEQKRMLDMLEMLFLKYGLQAKLHKLQVDCVNESNCKIRLQLDVASLGYEAAIDKVTSELITEQDLPSVMGKAYQENLTLEQAAAYIKEQAEKQQEYFVLKSMSDKKDTIMSKIEHLATENDMFLQLSNIRFMIQS